MIRYAIDDTFWDDWQEEKEEKENKETKSGS